MGYTNFTLSEVVETFELTYKKLNLFPEIVPIPIKIYSHFLTRKRKNPLTRFSVALRQPQNGDFCGCKIPN